MTKKFWNVAFDEMDINGLVRCYDQSKEHVAYRIQWRRIDRYKSAKDSVLESAGIYLMIERHARGDLPRIYVGQGDKRENGKGMLNRVKSHRKFAWCEEVVFLPIKQHYDASVLNHLERAFYDKVKDAGNYAIENKIAPHNGKVREELVQDVEEFLANSECLLAVLGYMPFTKNDKPILEAKDILYASGTAEPDVQEPVPAETKQQVVMESIHQPTLPGIIKRKPFAFSSVGIAIGEEIEFTEGPEKVRVAEDKKVSYNGSLYTLTGFVKKHLPPEKRCPSGAYQGPKYFTYKGRRLADMARSVSAGPAPAAAVPKGIAAVQPQPSASDADAVTTTETWEGKTQLARLIAKRGRSEGGWGGILRYFSRRKPCSKASKWRKLMEDVGIKFDAQGYVTDWACAKKEF